MGRYWELKSKWDYLVLLAPIQWLLFGGGLVIGVLGSIIAGDSSGFAMGMVGILPAMVVNLLSPLIFVGIVFGYKYHDNMDPGVGYFVAALLFAPVVGLDYLRKTDLKPNYQPSSPEWATAE